MINQMEISGYRHQDMAGGTCSRTPSPADTPLFCYPDLSAYEEYVKPIFQDGDILLQVDCGGKVGMLYVSKLCQGSKGPCIFYADMWLTPNEFQFISGRETAKDWKRSIRHYGKSMKLLLSKGVIAVHPLICMCDGCSNSAPTNRLRLSEKIGSGRFEKSENGEFTAGGLHHPSGEPQGVLQDSCCGPALGCCLEECKPLMHQSSFYRETMDSSKKNTQTDSFATEPKKESRLTSIIDQLLISKSKIDVVTDDDEHLMDNGTESSDGETYKLDPRNKCGQQELEEGTCSSSGQQQKDCSEEDFSPAGRDGPVTAKHPESGSRGQQPAVVSGVTTETARAAAAAVSSSSQPPRQKPVSGSMPTDTLATVDAGVVPIKSERFSPDVESSSPSVSPHSPSPARAFPSNAALGFGFGLRPGVSQAGLDRFSPATLTGSAPALKQMEMMTRNYSDFMRSLAAKYNNQSTQDSLPFGQANGMVRGLESNYPLKTSSTPPLLGRTADADSNGRKTEGSPPILLDPRYPPYNLSDFSSSQTLLNLVRTASAQSASQLENYLRGAAKRTLDGENPRGDPLDLSSKRLRTDSPSPHGSGRIHSPGGARDLRELVQNSLKLEAEILGSADLNAALRLSAKKSQTLSSLLDGRLQKIDFPIGGRLSTGRIPSSNDKSHCLSLCTEQSCSSKSDASEVAQWTVDQVVDFVASLDGCSEYADKFREESIDGGSLALLTEEHLTAFLGMKLGPALRLRSALAKRIGHCALCMHCIHCHKASDQSEPSRSPPVSK